MKLSIDVLREVSARTESLERNHAVLNNIVPLQNSEIVAFASLYCKLYKYSLFILGGGRWKYDTKIRDIYLTMVSLWPFFFGSSCWLILAIVFHTLLRGFSSSSL